MAAIVNEVVVGATKSTLEARWKNEDGTPIDLTDGSAKLQGQSEAMPDVDIDVAGEVTDPENGIVTFHSIGTFITQAQLDAHGLHSVTYSLRVKFVDSEGLFDFSETFFIRWVEGPLM